MKECRLVIHPGTLEKCERLGIENGETFPDRHPFLIIKKIGGKFKYSFYPAEDYVSYHKDLPEITNKEFMSWPDPIKKDDWVKAVVDGCQLIFNVVTIRDGYAYSSYGSHKFRTKDCKKLTPEQVEVLCL